MAIRWKLDSTIYNAPEGANTATISATLEDRHRTEKRGIGLDVTFEGAAASYIKTQYASSPCGRIDVEVEEAACYGGTYSTIIEGYIYLSEVTFENLCARCRVRVNIEDASLSAQVERNQDSEVEMSGAVQCRPFEVETGVIYPEADEFNIYRCVTALDTIIGQYSNSLSSVSSSFLSTTHQSHIISFTVPAVANGDVFGVLITTHIGGIYTVTVTADATATSTTVAEYLAKAICLRDGTSLPDVEEIVFRVNASHSGTTVTVEAFAEMTNFQFQKNSVDQSTTTVQAWRYAMGELHVSEKGLDPQNNLITFQKLYTPLQRLFDLQLQFQNGSVVISRHEDIYDGATATVTGVTGNRYDLSPDNTWMAQNLRLGSLRTITGYNASQSAWVSPDIDVNITRSTVIPLVNNAFFDMEAFTGNGEVDLVSDFYVRPENGEITVILELQVFNNTGGTITTPVNIGMVIGAVTVETQNHTFINVLAGSSQSHTYVFTPNYCLPLVGGFIQWQFTGVTSAGLDYGGTSNIDVDYEPTCFTAPQVKEDAWTFQQNETEFSACPEAEIDLSVDEDFYCGLGYELNQKLQGLQDLENTWFFVMADTITGDPLRFERRLFFPSAVGCCYDDDFADFPFYNMLLQRPYVVANWLYGFPGDLDRVEYQFEMDYDFATNTFSETVTRSVSTETAQQDFRQFYESEAFLPTSDVLDIISDLVAGFDICGTSDTVRWNQIEHDITKKRTRFRLLSETIH